MLETIWFLLWGLLWAIYFMLDGFDLGLGTLMPFLGKNEKERQLMHSSVAPFWDGNEVWLITAGGVTFAAFPGAYAVLFSAFYTPLMIILFALIIRAVSIEFRNKREDRPWRSLWDIATAMGSFLPALLFGVAFANIFKGIPIDADGVFHGTILTLLNPYGIAGGLFFLFLFLVHGTLWLAIKSEGELQKRAIETAKRLWVILVIFAVIFLISTAFFTTLYSNYVNHPFLFVVPFIAVCALFLTRYFMNTNFCWPAWLLSSLVIMCSTLFGVIGLYPNLLPSSINPAYSITISNSSSSPLTLKIMLVVAIIFVPVVIIYQSWVYKIFSGKIKEGDLEHEETY